MLKILSYLNIMPYLILHLMIQVMIFILFLLLICWKVFPERCQHQKNVLWINCTVSLKGIKSLFSLRSDIKLEISVQKTNKGCTSYLADSQSFLQRKSCERYQCATRETHFDSAKFDVHPLFVFCMPESKLVIDS